MISQPPPTLPNPNVGIGTGRPVAPPQRPDCRLSNYVYLGGRSYCTFHPVGACPFGVPPFPTRRQMSFWRRLWFAFNGYGWEPPER